MPVGASAVSRSDWSAPFPSSPSALRTRKSLIIKATIISDDPPRSAPLVILPSISRASSSSSDARAAKRPELPTLTLRLLLNISVFLFFFLRVSFFVHHDFFFMFAISSVIRQTLGYAISNFKLRFVPRELSNVVVDAPSSSVSLPCLRSGKLSQRTCSRKVMKWILTSSRAKSDFVRTQLSSHA